MKNFYILLVSIFIINSNLFASSTPNEELQNADLFAGASDKASAKIFNESCVSCHSGGVPRAPHSTTFSAMSADYILEKKVNLMKEISVVITRFLNGDTYIYEPIENFHKDQILNHSKIPADINKEIFIKAQNNAKLISEKLDYVGTMCVEYFIDQDDNLLVNEIAPRVHNSGHLTINAFNISQFENHVRAVCDLGLEKVEKISNAEMFNVLGKDIETYRSKTFNTEEFFYDYGKKTIKDKRKMGHLTILKK